MPYKEQLVDKLGTVRVSKRKGVRHLRIRLTPAGAVRVTIPFWLPYKAGFQFAQSKQNWVLTAMSTQEKLFFEEGSRIGKAHVLRTNEVSQVRVGQQFIDVPPGLLPASHDCQALVRAGERALRRQAEILLPKRLDALAKLNGFSYRNYNIKKMTSRWGSCSSTNDITLSTYLIQLPWELIDYVLLHELAHTSQHNHSAAFWQIVEGHMPNYKERRRRLKGYRPALSIEA